MNIFHFMKKKSFFVISFINFINVEPIHTNINKNELRGRNVQNNIIFQTNKGNHYKIMYYTFISYLQIIHE